jgi:BirA family transcriptional regulator, biotin operon repressor / biotin---[acetyl-CoA-carboxylase] ligase
VSVSDLSALKHPNLKILSTTTSTNDAAREWLNSGAADGATLVADFQTAGRGRLGREWHSARGLDLTLSVIFKAPIESLRLVPLLGGLAVRATVEEFLPPVIVPQIKWPNDIMAVGFKLAGILAELVSQPVSAAILGLGINLNTRAEHFPDDLRRPAASLGILSGQAIKRDLFLESLLFHLDAFRKIWLQTPRSLVRTFSAHCLTLGKKVKVAPPGREPFEAMASGVDPFGTLMVKDKKGEIIPVEAGDVDLVD